MKKLTWLLMSLMLFLGMGTAFAGYWKTNPTFSPASGTVTPGQEITFTLPGFEDGMTVDDYSFLAVLYDFEEDYDDLTTFPGVTADVLQQYYNVYVSGNGTAPNKAYKVLIGIPDGGGDIQGWVGEDHIANITVPADAAAGSLSFTARFVGLRTDGTTIDRPEAGEDFEATYTVTGGDGPVTPEKPAKPTFSPEQGTVDVGTKITITGSANLVWYTTTDMDGELNKDNWQSKYEDTWWDIDTKPLTINQTTTVRAVSVGGELPANPIFSDVETATYTVVGGEDLLPTLTLSKETIAVPVVGGAAVFSCTLDPQKYNPTSGKVGFVVKAENGSAIAGLECQIGEDGEWVAYNEQALNTLKSGANMAAAPTSAAATSRVVELAEITVNYRLKLSEGVMMTPQLVFSLIETSQYGTIPTTGQNELATASVSVKPAVPTFDPAEGKVTAGQEIACTLTEGLDAEAYSNMAFILYVENDDETVLETDAETLMAIVSGGGASPMADGEGEDPVDVPYKVGFYAFGEEEWMMPVAISDEADGVVKFRARLALVDAEAEDMPVYYSNEINTVYYTKVVAPTFEPAAGEVPFGTEIELACELQDATIYFTTDGTTPTTESEEYNWMSSIMIDKAMTVKAIAVLDGEASTVAEAAYTVAPIHAVVTLSPLKDDNTVGKNVSTGLSIADPENPVSANWIQNYPAEIYYTVDGTTEPSKEAYEAQTDKENGAIKMLAVKWEDQDGWYGPVSDNEGNFMSLTFTEDTHLKAIGYMMMDEDVVVTALLDQELKVMAGANATFSRAGYTKVAAGDKLVVENPYPYPAEPDIEMPEDWDDEEGWAAYEAAWDEYRAAIAEIPATELYFSFDGTKPTRTARLADDNESVFNTKAGKNVEIFFGEDEDGFYAFVPEILGYNSPADTIRLAADGKISVQVLAITTVTENGGDGPMPMNAKWGRPGASSFMYGSDYVKGYYTMNEDFTVEAPSFTVKAGEVEKGTKVEITCATKEASIYYTVDGSEPTAESAAYKEAIEITEAMTIKAVAVKYDLLSEVATATYTIEADKPGTEANEDLELAGVSVYPNPTSGQFNLELPVAATVEVFMSNGMLYQRLTLGEGNTTLNINRSGIYFLRITGEGRTAIKRLIVR